jgi:hypothetical protein
MVSFSAATETPSNAAVMASSFGFLDFVLTEGNVATGSMPLSKYVLTYWFVMLA